MINNLCCVLSPHFTCKICDTNLCSGCKQNHVVSRIGKKGQGGWMYCPNTQTPAQWGKGPTFIKSDRDHP